MPRFREADFDFGLAVPPKHIEGAVSLADTHNGGEPIDGIYSLIGVEAIYGVNYGLATDLTAKLAVDLYNARLKFVTSQPAQEGQRDTTHIFPPLDDMSITVG